MIRRSLQIGNDRARATFAWAPVSLAYLVLLWGIRIAFHFDTRALRRTFGFTLSDNFEIWKLVTSAMASASWAGAIISTFAILTVGIAAERLLGSRRYLLYAIGMHLVGLLIGSAIASGLDWMGFYWGYALQRERVLTPLIWLFGVAAVSTGLMNALWRRRIRLGLVGLSLTLILYAGILADFAMLSAVLVGLAIANRRYLGDHSRHKPSIREARILVALILSAVFLGPVLTAVNPDATGPFSTTSFLVAPQMSSEHVAFLCDLDANSRDCKHAIAMVRTSGFGPFVANFIPLIVVFTIAYGLSRGRRLAWWAALSAQAMTLLILLHELRRIQFVSGESWFSAVLAIWLLLPWIGSAALLIYRRNLFKVKLDLQSRLRFFGYLAVWLGLAVSTWIVGAMLLRDSFRNATFTSIVEATPVRFIPPAVGRFYAWDILPMTTPAWWLTEWVGTIFWIGAIIIFYKDVTREPNPKLASQREHARELLTHSSGDHLAWMTLWPGNSYWFGEHGYVAYRIHNSIAVTVGEPVCAPEKRHELADAFEQEIYARGAQVAWYSVREAFAEERSQHGWNYVPVAEEAILDASAEVEFKGKKFQDVRTARNRATKEGIHTEWTTWAEAGVSVRDQIVALSEEWISDKSLPEMGFTLGGLPELDDPEVRLMIAMDEDGRVHGVTSWLPSYVDGKVEGLVLDFMRRHTDGFRPVVEYLIAETLVKAHEEGMQWISLSGAPLAVNGSGLLSQVLERVGSAMEPLYGFRSLAAFKRKFNPTHEQWVMAYRDELALPGIGMAVSKCYLPNMDVGQAVHVFKQLRPKKQSA